MLVIRIILSSILFISSCHLSAQIIDNDQASSSIKWRQIQLEKFTLLYPQTFENTAQKLASQLPLLQVKSSRDLSVIPHRTTLVLQGNHLSQNGYVQLAPRKSELFPIPSSTADNQEWLPNLALHELRHIAQFDKLTGKLRGPFFEQLGLALYALNLPAWYFEGDAVQIETIHSAGGRGRLPSWDMPVRANMLSGKHYGFNKYVLGSFKDNVPSYYTIGFLMNTYMTNHFGLDSHEKIMNGMRGKLLRPFNFQKAVRHVSGMKPAWIFRETLSELHEKWNSEIDTNSIHQEIKTPESRYPSDYLLPQQLSDQRIVALKTSPRTVNEIVVIDTSGNESSVVKTGLQITPYFHHRDQYITWDEYRKDARFGKQTYNVINVYNMETGKLKTLTKKSRYYSPVFHPTHDQIAVVEVNEAGESRIAFINAENGKLMDSVAAPQHIHLQQPKFNDAGDKIVAIAVGPEGTCLIELHLRDRKYVFLTPWDSQQLERPFYNGNSVIFKAHYDGIDNIYQRDEHGRLFKLTNVAFGAFNPSRTADHQLLFNDYHYNGYKLARQPLARLQDTIAHARPLYILPTLTAADNQHTAHEPQYIPSAPAAYRPTANMINFHSLSISSTNFESFDNYVPGIFWLSNDVLNTTEIKVGYEFDPDISKSTYSAGISYKRYLPVFTVRYANRGLVGNAVGGGDGRQVVMFDYRDHLTTIDVSLPFSIYRQNYVYSYGLNFGTSYTKRYDVSIPLKNFNESIAFPLNYQIYLNRNSMRGKMDIAPKWGQNISVTYRHLPFEKQLSGQILSLRTNFYIPGLLLNHSLQLRFAVQKGTGRYDGVYDIPMVSGWGHFISPIVTNTALASYRLPLFYPDWSIGSLAYIKRFQGLLFSDFQNLHQAIAPKSFGIGISADFNVFRYVLPDINVATKLTYVNDMSAPRTIVPSFSLSYSY
ncbi:MAG TPA: hypothetical protein VK017_01030 [Sphingobacterium sp.]|nr:hypothetical protein [Sphingobacterium sp.]